MSVQDKTQAVESPCIAVCQLDDDERYCMGCYRTPHEIECWSKLSDQEKLHIIESLAKRREEAAA